MESTRQLKFASLIKRELGDLLFKEGANYYGSGLVSITNLMVSPDLGYVKVYLSVMGVADRENIPNKLNVNKRDVRHRLGKKIRHQVRHIPDLNFFLDDSFDYVEKIEKLFQEIGPIPPAEDDKPSVKE